MRRLRSKRWRIEFAGDAYNSAHVGLAVGHKDVRTAMLYQHTELKIVRAALNQGPATRREAQWAEKFLRPTQKRNPGK
jgi:hypothetical protein